MKTLDTRDLYTRKCELESLRDAVTSARDELEEAIHARSISDPDEPGERTQEELDEAVKAAKKALKSAEYDFGPDEQEELDELENLESEIRGFMHGESMIPESDFEDYARELAGDLGTIEGTSWPCNCIDWKQAAKELAMDYTSVTYQGTEYLVHS